MKVCVIKAAMNDHFRATYYGGMTFRFVPIAAGRGVIYPARKLPVVTGNKRGQYQSFMKYEKFLPPSNT